MPVKAGVITIDFVGRTTTLRSEADAAVPKIRRIGTEAEKAGKVTVVSMVSAGNAIKQINGFADNAGAAIQRYSRNVQSGAVTIGRFAREHEAALVSAGNAIVVYERKANDARIANDKLARSAASTATTIGKGLLYAAGAGGAVTGTQRLIELEKTRSILEKVVDGYRAARLAYAGYVSYMSGSISAVAYVAATMAAAAAAVAAVKITYQRANAIQQQALYSAQSGISFENVDLLDRLQQRSQVDTRGFFGKLQSQSQANPEGVRGALDQLGATGAVGDPHVLAQIAKGFQEIKDPVEQSQIAVTLFGDRAGEALDTFGKKFEKAAEDVDKFSVPMDKWSRTTIKQFRDDVNAGKEDLIAFGKAIEWLLKSAVGLNAFDDFMGKGTGAFKTQVEMYVAGTWDMLKAGNQAANRFMLDKFGATPLLPLITGFEKFPNPPRIQGAAGDVGHAAAGNITDLEQARKRESETIEGQRRIAAEAEGRSQAAYEKIKADDRLREDLQIRRAVRPDLTIPEPAGMLSGAQRDRLSEAAQTDALVAKVTNDHVRAMEAAKSTTEILSERLHSLTTEMQYSTAAASEAGKSQREKREIEAQEVVNRTREELARRQVAATTKPGEPTLAPTAAQLAAAMTPEQANSLKQAALAELEVRDATAMHIRSVEGAKAVTELLTERFFNLQEEMGRTAVQITEVGKSEKEKREIEVGEAERALRVNIARRQIEATTPPGEVPAPPNEAQIANALSPEQATRFRQEYRASLDTTAEREWRGEVQRTIDTLERRIRVQAMLTDAIGNTAAETDDLRATTELMDEFGKSFDDAGKQEDIARIADLKKSLAEAERAQQVKETNTTLSREIELEKSLAAVQLQGKDAIDLVTLAYKLRALSAAGLGGEIAKEIELYNAKKANADLASTREETERQQDAIDKLDLEIEGEKKLAAAQLQGAEAVRRQSIANQLAMLDYNSGQTDVFSTLSKRTAEFDTAKHNTEITREALSTAQAYRNQLDTLNQQLAVILNLEDKQGKTRDLEVDRLAIEKQISDTLVKQALQTGTLMDGLKAFFTNAAHNAEKPGQILYDGLNHAIDGTSGELAKLATGQKHNFPGMLQSVGGGMAQQGIKVLMQEGIGALGGKLGLDQGKKAAAEAVSIAKGNRLGALLKATGGQRYDGQSLATAIFVQLAPQASGTGYAGQPAGGGGMPGLFEAPVVLPAGTPVSSPGGMPEAPPPLGVSESSINFGSPVEDAVKGPGELSTILSLIAPAAGAVAGAGIGKAIAPAPPASAAEGGGVAPGYAGGTDATPVNSAYLVGEKGPELEVNSSSHQVIPLDRLGGGGDVYIDARNSELGTYNRILAAQSRISKNAVDTASRVQMEIKNRSIQYR